MSVSDFDKSRELLSELMGLKITHVECDVLHLELVFEYNWRFVTQSPWRVFVKGDLVLGSADDIEKNGSKEVLGLVNDRKVIAVAISDCGDTKLLFEHDHVLEIIANSARYETWEAHLSAGLIVFALGGITVFPPSPARPNPPPMPQPDLETGDGPEDYRLAK